MLGVSRPLHAAQDDSVRGLLLLFGPAYVAYNSPPLAVILSITERERSDKRRIFRNMMNRMGKSCLGGMILRLAFRARSTPLRMTVLGGCFCCLALRMLLITAPPGCHSEHHGARAK